MTTRIPQETVLFESSYGQFQPRYLWMCAALGVVGAVGAAVGLFWNTGWEMGGRPLEPWSATLIIEIVSLGALAIAAYAWLLSWKRRTSPQRVTVTHSSLIIPKGGFSSEERALPLNEIDLKIFDVGFVKQLQIMHGRKKTLITSALFPSNAHFDRFVSHLPR